ncbi:hypothetical protein, partial [Pseudomonas sp. HY7a-MNA-CIBAN-0227]|uniref:hypothetical protein n=1 Tax=Pseudomonas sp. HY7a-MNA-CIBAN-0227 TaxID=3140474 RepID=UPI0033213D1D
GKVFGDSTTITGTVTGANGGTVTVSIGENVLGEATVGDNGEWELVLETGTGLESGTQNITATVSSKAGITAEAADPV